MSQLSGKIALITGGGGHAAKGIAKVFAKEGAAVAGLDVSEQALEGFTAAVNEVGGRSLAICCDLRDWAAVKSAVDRVVETLGSLDIVVNTATARTDPVWKGIEEVTQNEMTDLMEVGPNAALAVMQAAFVHMKEKGGKIINFGSGGGRSPAIGLGAYGASKAAMHSLTKAAAREWAKYKINVNGILPFMMSPNMARTMEEEPERMKAHMPPLGWAGDAERDIGRAALFLASSASDFITGQNLPVDGGVDMML